MPFVLSDARKAFLRNMNPQDRERCIQDFVKRDAQTEEIDRLRYLVQELESLAQNALTVIADNGYGINMSHQTDGEIFWEIPKATGWRLWLNDEGKLCGTTDDGLHLVIQKPPPLGLIHYDEEKLQSLYRALQEFIETYQ